jgi:hypothetical protein
MLTGGRESVRPALFEPSRRLRSGFRPLIGLPGPALELATIGTKIIQEAPAAGDPSVK